jgi:AAA domain
MTARFSPSDFSQRLRQIRPIYSLEELGAAACQAAPLIRAGEVTPAQAGDDLWGMAVASGLLEKYGADAVQGAISCGLRLDPEADGLDSERLDREIEDALDARANAQSSTLPRVSAINLEGFLNMNIPPRAMMLTPWLPVQGLAMIYAPRGTGKTRMAHGILHAIATGSGFLRWAAPQPKRVLLLDGEMPAPMLQEMLRATVKASKCSLPDPSFFKIAAADLVRDGLPDLANPSAQQFYSDVIADADLVGVDNLSTLCRSLRENDADSWTPVQSWVLGLRRAGKSAFLIHHGGKSGAQRGTSRKEDTCLSRARASRFISKRTAVSTGAMRSHSRPACLESSGPSTRSNRATIPTRSKRSASRECRFVTLLTVPVSPNRLSNAGSTMRRNERCPMGHCLGTVPWDSWSGRYWPQPVVPLVPPVPGVPTADKRTSRR